MASLIFLMQYEVNRVLAKFLYLRIKSRTQLYLNVALKLIYPKPIFLENQDMKTVQLNIFYLYKFYQFNILFSRNQMTRQYEDAYTVFADILMLHTVSPLQELEGKVTFDYQVQTSLSWEIFTLTRDLNEHSIISIVW